MIKNKNHENKHIHYECGKMKYFKQHSKNKYLARATFFLYKHLSLKKERIV